LVGPHAAGRARHLVSGIAEARLRSKRLAGPDNRNRKPARPILELVDPGVHAK
jgi:hypothetical protein